MFQLQITNYFLKSTKLHITLCVINYTFQLLESQLLYNTGHDTYKFSCVRHLYTTASTLRFSSLYLLWHFSHPSMAGVPIITLLLQQLQRSTANISKIPHVMQRSKIVFINLWVGLSKIASEEPRVMKIEYTNGPKFWGPIAVGAQLKLLHGCPAPAVRDRRRWIAVLCMTADAASTSPEAAWSHKSVVWRFVGRRRPVLKG